MLANGTVSLTLLPLSELILVDGSLVLVFGYSFMLHISTCLHDLAQKVPLQSCRMLLL